MSIISLSHRWTDAQTQGAKKVSTYFPSGGSTCPEHLEAGAWEISREVEDKWTWVADPDLKVICVPETNKGHEAGSHEDPHRFPPSPYVMKHPRQKEGDSQEYLEGIPELAAGFSCLENTDQDGFFF